MIWRMRQIWIIAQRELRMAYDSLTAYVLTVAFLAFTGLFTWLYGSDIFLIGQASLESFFSTAFCTLFFFIPALTMKSVAEERKAGTLELILTKPVTELEFLWGKFLGCFLHVTIVLALTLPYYISVSFLGPVDHSAVWCGYLGLMLMSAAYISIGIFSSSLSSSQIVAFLVALFVGVFFHFLFGLLAQSVGALGRFFEYLSVTSHYQSVVRGVLDSRDVIFFLSLVVTGIFCAGVVMIRRKFQGK